MSDPQVVWVGRYGEWYGKRATDHDKPAIVMTPDYRAELRALVAWWHSTGRAGGYDLAAAIEKMLEVTK